MSDEYEFSVSQCALSIANMIGAARPGVKASTRRMSDIGNDVFWRQVAQLGIPRSHEMKWLRFMRMVAILTPPTANKPIHLQGRKFGAVLADGGDDELDLLSNKPVFAETRLLRLLASRNEHRLVSLERAVRMIANRHPQCDVVDLAYTVLSNDMPNLARDYYSRIAKRISGNSKNV